MTRARDIADRNVDSTTIDGVDSTQLLRSDVADTKTAGDLSFADNVKAQFGAGNDLQIFHNGSNSIIKDAGSGDLQIRAQDLHIKSPDGVEDMARFLRNGAVRLYYDNAKKLETTSTGIDVTGLMNIDGSSSGNGQVRAALSTGGLGLRASSGANNSTVMDFDAPDVSASGGAVTYRFGRGTTEGSSDVSKLQFFNHDGTSGIAAEINSLGQITANNRLVLGEDAFIAFEGATNNSNETLLTVTDPTADRTITLPDASGTVVLSDSDSVSVAGKIVHTGDSDTFIEFNDANNIRFVTNNTTKINIQPSAVVVNEASNDIDFRVESNGNANMLFVDGGNDRVGIGTGSPAVQLHVKSSGNAELRLEETGGDVCQLISISNEFRIGSVAANPMTFRTGNTERMRIDTNGHVGIGTTATSVFNAEGAASRLVVAGSDTSTTRTGNSEACITIVNTDGTAGNTSGLHFAREDNDGSPNYAGASIVAQFPDAQVTGQYPKGRLVFLTSTTANAAPVEKMRIMESGRMEFQTPTNTNGTLADQRIDWRNENNAGVMASIGVYREANPNAPSSLVFRTSNDVDSSSNGGDGNISEKMRISSAGIVTKGSQPCFFGYLSGSGNKTSATGAGVINTAAINVGSHFSTSNGRFTCPVAGYYLVMWTGMNHQSNTGTGLAALRVNGTRYKYFHMPNSHPQGQSDQLIYNASANDYFDLEMTHFHYNGGSANKYPSFSVYLLG